MFRALAPDSSRTVVNPIEERSSRGATLIEEPRPRIANAAPSETGFDALRGGLPRVVGEFQATGMSIEATEAWRSPLDKLRSRTEVDVVADARVALLTREKSSQEDDARFRILTERLRKLSPAVSTRDMDALEATANQLEEMDATLAAMKKKYGR